MTLPRPSNWLIGAGFCAALTVLGFGLMPVVHEATESLPTNDDGEGWRYPLNHLYLISLLVLAGTAIICVGIAVWLRRGQST